MQVCEQTRKDLVDVDTRVQQYSEVKELLLCIHEWEFEVNWPQYIGS